MNDIKKLKKSFKITFLLGTIQILGLKPYQLIGERFIQQRSIPLSIYNVIVATLVFLNAYLTRQDPRNDVDYDNVAVLIGVAFAAVDFFGNLYICYAMIRTPLEIKTSASVWIRLRAIDQTLSSRVNFDYARMQSYACIKIFLVFLLIGIFAVIEVICCTRLNLYLTIGYYITSLLPLFYSFSLSILFGCVSLIIFQRYWAVNDALEEMTDQELIAHTQFSTNISTSQNWCRLRIVPKKAFQRTKKPPIYMMFNYKQNSSSEEENFLRKIRKLKQIHFELYELINEFNSSFGFHFLFQFIFFFFGCTVNIYYVIIFHLRPYEVEQYVSSCFWSIFLLFLVSYIVFHANLVTDEACRTTDLIHLFLTRAEFCESRLKHELNSFSSQLMQCQIHIRAGGFFVINSPFLFQFLTGVLSSVIFVVQFDKVNFGR